MYPHFGDILYHLAKKNPTSSHRWVSCKTHVLTHWSYVSLALTHWYVITRLDFTDLVSPSCPDSNVHGANMGPTWVLSAPGGPHVDEPCYQGGFHFPDRNEVNQHRYLDMDRQLYMMTSSNGNIFRVTGHLCGEFTGHR